MKSIQGKEFELEDILLYSVKNNKIYVLFDDQEQMKRFKSGILNENGTPEFPPMATIPYTKENEYKIVSGMKKINNYTTSEGYVEVVYKKGKKMKYDIEEEATIKHIYEVQKKISEDITSMSFNTLTDFENKQSANKKWRRAVVGILAAVTAVTMGGVAWANKDKISDGINKMNKDNSDPINPTQSELIIPTSEVALIEQNIIEQKVLEEYTSVANYDFTEKGKELYNEVISKDTIILKYQQAVNVNWNEETAISVVEYLNGKYPSVLLAMSDRDAKAKEIEIKEAWALLIAGNLNPETTKANIVDLSKYAIKEQDIELIQNADEISRNIANKTVGGPMNGQILDEFDFASVNKFSSEYLEAADQLLKYEMAILNGSMYENLSVGARWHIATIFSLANAYVNPWQTIELDNGEIKYFRCFEDEETGKTYYPILGENGTVNYRCDAEDKIYNEYEMYAMVDIPMLEEDRATRKGNSTIKMQGIQVLSDNAKDNADLDLTLLRELAETYEQDNQKGAK